MDRIGLVVLYFLPVSPATSEWVTDREKAWLHRELARDAELIGAPVRHNILAAFANTRVLLLGAAGLLGNGAGGGLLLSAPAVLIADTGMSTMRAGTLVSVGGALGALSIIIAGWRSDHRGDRLGDAFALTLVLAASLLLLGAVPAPAAAVIGYLLFAATFFTAGMLVVSSWADVLHIREVAIGSAAINTLWQIGAFLSPYVWGVMKDATGSFRPGLIGAAVLAIAQAMTILFTRSLVLAARRAHSTAIEQSQA